MSGKSLKNLFNAALIVALLVAFNAIGCVLPSLAWLAPSHQQHEYHANVNSSDLDLDDKVHTFREHIQQVEAAEIVATVAAPQYAPQVSLSSAVSPFVSPAVTDGVAAPSRGPPAAFPVA